MSASSLETSRKAPVSAIVVGGGVGGILAAHVACRHFKEVTLLDADRLDAAAEGGAAEGGAAAKAAGALAASKRRHGIPQYMQPHTLAMGGLKAIDQLLPGFHEELVMRGGVPLDLGRDFRFYDFGAQDVRSPSSLQSVGASRHLIQSTLQAEVLRRNAGRLHVRDGCRVAGLHWSSDKGSVLGVELEGGEVLKADVVIFASGRFCKLPQWLAGAGHEQPPVQRVDCRLTYVGRLYRIPEDWDNRWKGHITFGRPHGLCGAGMVPVEGGTWQVCLWGINGIVPPMDEAGFQRYAASLPDTQIFEAMQRAEPLSPLAKYGGACNVQRRYDRIPLPPGLLVIGDAAQALNPVYAQGMSVAAMSTVALDAELAAVLNKAGGSAEAQRAAVRSMGPAFQRKLVAVIEPAWQLATAEDMRYPGTKAEGVSRPPRLLSAYIDTLFIACHHNLQLWRHCLKSRTWCAHPPTCSTPA